MEYLHLRSCFIMPCFVLFCFLHIVLLKLDGYAIPAWDCDLQKHVFTNTLL